MRTSYRPQRFLVFTIKKISLNHYYYYVMVNTFRMFVLLLIANFYNFIGQASLVINVDARYKRGIR